MGVSVRELGNAALAASAGQAWLVVGFGVLALACGTAWTSRYVVRQYVAARLDLARLKALGRRES